MASDSIQMRFNSAKGVAVEIGKKRAAFDPKWKEVTTKLRAAIKDKQNDRIDLYATALDGNIKTLNQLLRLATVCRGSLREVELDDEFVAANLKQVEAAVTVVSDAVAGFTEQYKEGKALQNEAEKSGGRFAMDANQAMISLSGLEEDMNENLKQLITASKKADAVRDRAMAAADSNDAKGLEKAQKEHEALGIDVTLVMYEGYVERMRKFGKEAAASKEYSKDLKEKLADGIADIERTVGQAEYYAKSLRTSVKEVQALAVKTIDVAKALKALQLEKAHEAALKKVLGGPSVAFELGLESIGKKLDPKQKGKEMLAKLKTAGVV